MDVGIYVEIKGWMDRVIDRGSEGWTDNRMEGWIRGREK
jgi:hypothetical protein